MKGGAVVGESEFERAFQIKASQVASFKVSQVARVASFAGKVKAGLLSYTRRLERDGAIGTRLRGRVRCLGTV
jgi:hypothetical protein